MIAGALSLGVMDCAAIMDLLALLAHHAEQDVPLIAHEHEQRARAYPVAAVED